MSGTETAVGRRCCPAKLRIAWLKEQGWKYSFHAHVHDRRVVAAQGRSGAAGAPNAVFLKLRSQLQYRRPLMPCLGETLFRVIPIGGPATRPNPPL